MTHWHVMCTLNDWIVSYDNIIFTTILIKFLQCQQCCVSLISCSKKVSSLNADKDLYMFLQINPHMNIELSDCIPTSTRVHMNMKKNILTCNIMCIPINKYIKKIFALQPRSIV